MDKFGEFSVLGASHWGTLRIFGYASDLRAKLGGGERRRGGGTAFSTHHITHARSFKLFVNCGRILQGLSANVSGRSCNHAC